MGYSCSAYQLFIFVLYKLGASGSSSCTSSGSSASFHAPGTHFFTRRWSSRNPSMLLAKFHRRPQWHAQLIQLPKERSAFCVSSEIGSGLSSGETHATWIVYKSAIVRFLERRWFSGASRLHFCGRTSSHHRNMSRGLLYQKSNRLSSGMVILWLAVSLSHIFGADVCLTRHWAISPITDFFVNCFISS